MKTEVQKEFEAFSMVPRCSFYNEKAIEYVINWAEKEGLNYKYDDKNGNVVINVPAHPSKKDHPTVILQGHLDMVPQVKDGMKHDFTKEPLDLKIKDGYYFAEGTTLGADDGVAVAFVFAAIKDKSIKNPPLEILFTTDEEVGMLSVKDANLKKLIKGKYLISLDCEVERSITLGCCGGHSVQIHLKKREEEVNAVKYKITVSGLTGGHSGAEIHQERGNALKLLGATLYELQKEVDFKVKSLSAPGKDNVICMFAEAEIIASAEDEAKIKKIVKSQDKRFKHIYRITDPKVKTSVKNGGKFKGKALNKNCTDKLISLLMQLPFGMLNREQERFSDTESSANIGIAETNEKEIYINCSIRSSVFERREMIVAQVENLCKMLKVNVEVIKEYPAWLPDFKTELIPIAQKAFKKVFGKEADLVTTHGGLESGFIVSKSYVKSAIAIGPDIFDIHSIKERMPVESLNKTYDALKEILNQL